jgi:hypothetical protein
MPGLPDNYTRLLNTRNSRSARSGRQCKWRERVGPFLCANSNLSADEPKFSICKESVDAYVVNVRAD